MKVVASFGASAKSADPSPCDKQSLGDNNRAILCDDSDQKAPYNCRGSIEDLLKACYVCKRRPHGSPANIVIKTTLI